MPGQDARRSGGIDQKIRIEPALFAARLNRNSPGVRLGMLDAGDPRFFPQVRPAVSSGFREELIHLRAIPLCIRDLAGSARRDKQFVPMVRSGLETVFFAVPDISEPALRAAEDFGISLPPGAEAGQRQ